MGILERKERERQELKQKIVEAAKHVLLTQGSEALSIRKIAEIVEYSPATLYLYYPDKDAILHDLMEVGFDMMSAYMVEGFKSNNPISGLRILGEKYIQFALENKDWYYLMFNSEKPMRHIEKCAEEWDKGMIMFNMIASKCKDALNFGNIKNVDPRIMALHLWSTVHGLINLAQSDRLEIIERNQTNQLIDQTLDMVLFAYFKTESNEQK